MQPRPAIGPFLYLPIEVASRHGAAIPRRQRLEQHDARRHVAQVPHHEPLLADDHLEASLDGEECQKQFGFELAGGDLDRKIEERPDTSTDHFRVCPI
jgi:hypothetical protein